MTSEAVQAAVAVMPGFLAVKVKDFFLPHRRATRFDLLLEVVAFSVANFVAAQGVLGIFGRSLADYSGSLAGYLSTLGACSVLLGLLSGWVVGGDLHYRLARWLRITRRTGRLDVWQDAFSDLRANWLVVHMNDGRRAVGWAKYFSDEGNRPSVFLKNAAWVEDDGAQHPIDGEGLLVLDQARISYIEFRGQEGRVTT